MTFAELSKAPIVVFMLKLRHEADDTPNISRLAFAGTIPVPTGERALRALACVECVAPTQARHKPVHSRYGLHTRAVTNA
jgi:hypothetical protein